MIEHRPRSASELVDVAFALLRRDYQRFCVTTAILTVPWLVVQLTLRRVLDLETQPMTARELAPFSWLLLVAVVWWALVSATLSQLAAATYEARSMDPPTALRAGGARFVPVFLALLLKYLLVVACFVGGMLAGALLGSPFIVMSEGAPGGLAAIGFMGTMLLGGLLAALFPLARYAPVGPVASLEPIGPVAALRRSRTLVKGRFRAALAVTALVFVLYLVLGVGANLLATAIDEQILPHVVSTIITVFVYPLVVIVHVALYYDLRIRSEGYDLELMTRQLAPHAPVDGPGASAPAAG